MATVSVVVWTYSRLIALLERSHEALERAILTINARQTEDERAGGVTRYENGRGWNARDAAFGGSLADWIRRGVAPRSEGGFGKAHGRCLTPKQREGALRMIRKYWRQLLEEVELKGGKVDYGSRPKNEGATDPAPTTRATSPTLEEVVAATPSYPTPEEGFDEPDF